jgi:hypothetical protein
MEENPVVQSNTSSLFSDNRNALIMILSILLILSIIGVTFMNTIFDAIRYVLNYVVGFTSSVFGTALYSTGDIVNSTSNSVADVAKTSIDLGNGAINDIGNLMKSGATGDNVNKINVAPIVVVPTKLPDEPEPTSPENPIQQSMQAPKPAWCYIGTINGARNCIKINPAVQACQSGRMYSSSNICVNP